MAEQRAAGMFSHVVDDALNERLNKARAAMFKAAYAMREVWEDIAVEEIKGRQYHSAQDSAEQAGKWWLLQLDYSEVNNG